MNTASDLLCCEAERPPEALFELDRREHAARVEHARIATRLAHYAAQLEAAQS